MDAALKAKWVEALRSGKYQQAFNQVERDGSLCCVGVGGIVIGLKPSIRRSEGAGSEACAFALGLTEDQAQILYKLNDHDRKTFPEIADYIEANL